MMDAARTVRPKTINERKASRRALRLIREDVAMANAEGLPRLPRTRGDCAQDERPCPFVSCRYHLYLDVHPETGGLKLNFPHFEPHEMVESCSLDVADREGVTLEQIGSMLSITKERVRQLQDRALARVHAAHGAVLEPYCDVGSVDPWTNVGITQRSGE